MRAFIIIAFFISSIASAVTLPIKMLRACIDYDNDIVTISWIPPTDDCGSFEKNVIYGSENLGPFEKIAEITDLSISEYPHTLTVQNTSWRYYITTHTDCGGSESLESDTIRIDITYPTNIELDSISYDLTTQNIIAGWQPNPSVDTKHYELYDYSSGSGDFLGKTSFLDFNISNVRGGRFPVVLATLDSCNLSSLLSTPHETTFLSGTIDTCTRSINLQWRRYIGWGDIDSQAVRSSDLPGLRLLSPPRPLRLPPRARRSLAPRSVPIAVGNRPPVPEERLGSNAPRRRPDDQLPNEG